MKFPFVLLIFAFIKSSISSSPISDSPQAPSECVADKPQGLCTVSLSQHTFAPNNLLLPENVRGVFWIDAGTDMPGKSNPWVDLNYMIPFEEGSGKEGMFYTIDATPGYQSWEDVPESYPYIKSFTSLGTRSEVDPTDLTVRWSACGPTCGTRFEHYFPLPLSSPSEQIGPNEYIRKAVVFGVTVSEWKGYRVVDEKGERTEFWDKIVERFGDVALVIKGEDAGD